MLGRRNDPSLSTMLRGKMKRVEKRYLDSRPSFMADISLSFKQLLLILLVSLCIAVPLTIHIIKQFSDQTIQRPNNTSNKQFSDQTIQRPNNPSNNQEGSVEFSKSITSWEYNKIMEWNEYNYKTLDKKGDQHYNYLKNLNISDIKSSIILDIGMCEGEESNAAVEFGLIVYAFEPVPRHIERIKGDFIRHMSDGRYKNVKDLSELMTIIDCKKEWKKCTGEILIEPKRHHPVYGHVYLFAAITSDEVSFTGMNISDAGGTSTVTQYALFNSDWNKSGVANAKRIVTAPTVRVDDIVHHNILWYKTDTQGFDYRTLRGSEKLFQNYDVTMVKSEFSPQMFLTIGDTASDYVHFMGREAGQKWCSGHDVSTEEGMDKWIEYLEAYMKKVPTWYCDLYCQK